MPSRFITLLSIGIFFTIVIGAIYYFETKWRIQKRKEEREEKSIIKKLTLKCELCGLSETFYDVKKEEFVNFYPCKNPHCNNHPRKLEDWL